MIRQLAVSREYQKERKDTDVRNARAMVEMHRVRILVPGSSATRGLSQLQDQVRLYRCHLLYARMRWSRVRES